jgi:hypothetical protein
MTLVREVVSNGLRSREFYRLYILGLLILYCGLFYYFGEIVDFFGWEALRAPARGIYAISAW